MRRILNYTYHHRATVSEVSKLIAAVVVMLSLGSAAFAQSMSPQIAPTANSVHSSPVSSAMAFHYNGQQYQTVSAAAVQNAAHEKSAGADSGVELAAHSLQQARRNRQQAMYCPPPFNPCKTGCDVTGYAQFDALYLDRRGDKFFSLSRGGFIDDGFDYEWAGRYTVGRLFDCVNGWEASFVGPFEWNRTGINAGPNSTLTAGGAYSALDIAGFNGSTLHRQDWNAEMYSFEVNRKWFVWDVLSTMIGTRFLNYEEDYRFVASGAGSSGLLLESVDNTLAGVQVGAELLYPVSLRASSGIRGKAGAYANFDQRRSLVQSNGATVVNAGDTDTELAGVIELSAFSSYYITPSIRITGGYEFWWLPGIATVPEQGISHITPSSGTVVSNEDDLFLHGVTAGAQIIF